jgi:hypothetical protein
MVRVVVPTYINGEVILMVSSYIQNVRNCKPLIHTEYMLKLNYMLFSIIVSVSGDFLLVLVILSIFI